ncbi:INO80 complex subunit B [Drosophila tropicalis]|uniref:INO80 complex subunit B n=1 Tax=Drosophila tropicalis TaxID=46794 RepID=UPI0035ABC8EA
MVNTENSDRRSKRSKRQKPARFVSPTPSPIPVNSQTPSGAAEENDSTPQPQLQAQAQPPQASVTEGSNILEFPSIRSKKPSAPPGNSTTPNAGNKKAKKPRRNSDTSSDEERWLNAIETGKLEDVDEELKKIKDPKLMTARQRAMYERTQDSETNLSGFAEELISLPTGYREKEKPQTAEEIQKAALKSQKRKQQADERREKDKQKTMERLLKKQESNKQRSAARNKQNLKPSLPTLTYMNTLDGAYIMVPAGQEFPLKPQSAIEPPARQLCHINGCSNYRAYTCSTTKVPLCRSLECYRKNLAASVDPV